MAGMLHEMRSAKPDDGPYLNPLLAPIYNKVMAHRSRYLSLVSPTGPDSYIAAFERATTPQEWLQVELKARKVRRAGLCVGMSKAAISLVKVHIQ